MYHTTWASRLACCCSKPTHACTQQPEPLPPPPRPCLCADSKGVSAALELQDILDPLLKSVEECGDELVGRTAAARMPDSRFGKGMRAANGATAVV